MSPGKLVSLDAYASFSGIVDSVPQKATVKRGEKQRERGNLREVYPKVTSRTE